VNYESVKADHFNLIDYKRWEKLDAQDFSPINKKIVILAYGHMVEQARKALDIIREKNIVPGDSLPELVYARSCKPLDDKFLIELFNSSSVEKIITLEESCLAGGFGSAVLEWAALQRLAKPKEKQPEIYCMGIKDQFIEHGARKILLKNQGLDPESLALQIESFVIP